VNINERIDQIAAIVDELRDAATDGRRSRQLIDALFRTVHSCKAAAAADGLTDRSRTAHQFENLLHSLRTGRATLDGDVLHACDETVAALRDGSQSAALNRFNETPRQTIFSGDDLPAEIANLKDDERHRALAAMREGARLYVMEVAFEVNDFDERFRRLKEQLEVDAEPISTSATMNGDKIIFKIVYASRSEKIPISTVLGQAVRAGEAVTAALGKQIEFVVKTNELLLEKSVADALTDALVHLVRNAVGHGIESRGTVLLEATAKQIIVTDDGRGITPENLSRVFQAGFSTAQAVTQVSGRGVGLDAVKTAVEELGGSIDVASEPGKGSSFKINLPAFTTPNPSSDA
jgi:chemotaxis protein histidine kinase CheA